MQGYLTKRGRVFKTWKYRWFKLEGSTLKYFIEQDGKQKGEMEVKGAKVEDVDFSVHKYHNCAAVVAPGRTLFIVATTKRDLAAWKMALNAASKGDTWTVGQRRRSMSGAVSLPPLPDHVHIRGVPEVGGLLQVKDTKGTLSRLSIQWLRFHQQPKGDVVNFDVRGRSSSTASTGGKERRLSLGGARRASISTPDKMFDYIAGARSATYVVSAADKGKWIGVVLQAPAGLGPTALGVTSTPVEAVDPTQLGLRIELLPHEHSKYCDRRIRVCTAPGKVREGEVIRAVPKGPKELIDKYKVVWRRIAPSDASGGGGGGGGGAGIDADEAESKHAFEIVEARPLTDLPPAPPDYAPAPKLDEFLHRPRAPPAPTTGRREYPLFSADVGYMIQAVLIPIDSSGESPVTSQMEGPVKPAPPKAREVWVTGEKRVGTLLVGQVYYFGGHEGKSICWWIRVTPDGDSVEITKRREVDASKPLPTTNRTPGVGDDDPRAYRLTSDDVDCNIKFKYKPVRDDGDEGHIETSRPTPEISI